ncbi:MAG: class I SAM-dependent methyltransferase [Spirochaetota bacterium]
MMLSFLPPEKTCPLCSSDSLSGHLAIGYKDYPFRTSRCTTCGFIFMNPRFTDNTIRLFYGKEYYCGGAGFAYMDERAKEKYGRYVWNARLRTIRHYAPGGNFLDIGASFGGFMRAAQRFYTPWGIELSEFSGSYAKKEFGGRLHIGTLSDHPFPALSFSVITMIEVIEHLSDPADAIKESFRLLSPGGVLVIQTADMDAWQAVKKGADYHYYLPGHISYFTEKSLRTALRREGFGRITVHRPVDFGLIPKLLKSRGSFTKISDYLRWKDIALYHMMGYFSYKGRPLTSSMVVYAVKPGNQ